MNFEKESKANKSSLDTDLDIELVKALLTLRVTDYIVNEYIMEPIEARSSFSKFRIFEALQDNEIELYGESTLHIFSLFQEKYDKTSCF